MGGGGGTGAGDGRAVSGWTSRRIDVGGVGTGVALNVAVSGSGTPPTGRRRPRPWCSARSVATRAPPDGVVLKWMRASAASIRLTSGLCPTALTRSVISRGSSLILVDLAG